MMLRNKGKIPIELNEQFIKAPEDAVDKNVLIEKDILLIKMQKCVRDLNSEQRQCVTLFYLEKKSYSEIAETTGYSMMQVKSYIQNGKRKLKLMMESGNL